MGEPFDARRAMLTDADRPRCDWRVASLITALRAALQPAEGEQQLPHADHKRVAAVNEIIDELIKRGIDGENLVRFGLIPEIVSSVVLLLLPRWRSRCSPGNHPVTVGYICIPVLTGHPVGSVVRRPDAGRGMRRTEADGGLGAALGIGLGSPRERRKMGLKVVVVATVWNGIAPLNPHLGGQFRYRQENDIVAGYG